MKSVRTCVVTVARSNYHLIIHFDYSFVGRLGSSTITKNNAKPTHLHSSARSMVCVGAAISIDYLELKSE